MAQDTRKALDDKTKKLSQGKIEEGKEHAAYQEAQQQLLAIQAEQQQHLAVARAESKASFDNNQTLAQAAELGAISAAEAEQAATMGAQAGVQLNPATQQILSKYGAGQPKFSRTSSHSQQVTKQNVTINNNITSNTTNDVNVPANIGGPLQGRPLQFKDPSTGEGSVGKFKTWISAAFARQNEEGAKRDREYRNRESSLTKSASRMMRKLEDIGKTIGSRMDPRKIGSTWQSQLKTLLLLFGFGYLTSNWTKILDQVSSIENWVKKTWAYFTGDDENNSFINDLKLFIGGSKDESLLTSFGKLLGKDGLFGYIKNYFDKLYEDRARAVKEVEFPKIDTGSIFNTLESLGEYLGNLFGAIMGGTESVKKTVAKQAEKKALSSSMEHFNKEGKSATTETVEVGNYKGDKGALALLDGSYKGLTNYAIDKNGNLDKDNLTEATLAASSEIMRIKNLVDNGDVSQTTSLVQQLNRLYNTAKSTRNNYVAVTNDFINSLTSDELKELSSRKLIQKSKYRVVYHEKTKDDLDRRENLDPNSRAADMYATQKVAYGVGGRLGSVATENYASAIFGEYGAPLASITEYGLTALERGLANKGRFILVRNGEKLKPGDYNTGVIKTVYEISPDGLKMIANRMSNRDLKENVDMEDKAALQASINDKSVRETNEIADRAEKKLQKKLQERYSDPADVQANSMEIDRIQNDLKELGIQRQRLNEDANSGYVGVRETVKDLDKTREQVEADFRQKTKDNRAVKTYRNIKGKVDEATDYVLGEVYTISNGKIGTPGLTVAQKDRSKYAMKRLMDEGLNKEQAAGIVGNMMRESGLNPKLGHTDSNGLHAGGIVQWNGPRYNAAKRYFGKPVEQVSFEDQFEYLIKELKGEVGDGAQERHGFLKRHGFKKGAPVLEVMKTTTSLQDSTDTFERIFEGSGDYAGYTDVNGVRHGGDRNKKRFDLAASVYKHSDGDLSNISWVSTSQASTEKEGKKKEKEDTTSFIQILKDKVTSFITSLGGIFSTASEEMSSNFESTSLPADKKFNGKVTKEFTDYQAYIENQGSLPDGLPSGLTYESWKNTVQSLTGSSPDKLQLSPESREILSKYEEPAEQFSTDYIKEQIKEASKTKTSVQATKVSVNPESSPKANDYLDIFDPKATQGYTMTFKDISSGIEEMNEKMDAFIQIGAIHSGISSDIVDAVNRGTAVTANSSKNTTKAIVGSSKNHTKSAPSLKTWDWDEGKFK